MNDFWEWRSSSREFDGKPDDIAGGHGSDRTRRGKLGLIIGVVLFVVLAAIFVIFEYAK
ncbi:hypothetical protein [Nitrobacter sp. TKz-YC02]|uniref:hypothetical protein n=1 Tax=Nitrobacter sp. TKz-YC02 TaxID=3398704 RepID=UPI003CF53AAF